MAKLPDSSATMNQYITKDTGRIVTVDPPGSDRSSQPAPSAKPQLGNMTAVATTFSPK